MGNEGPAFAAGLIVGVIVMEMVSFMAVMPLAHHEQFKKDCVKMAHGHVDKSSKTICVKNGKILFHE